MHFMVLELCPLKNVFNFQYIELHLTCIILMCFEISYYNKYELNSNLILF